MLIFTTRDSQFADQKPEARGSKVFPRAWLPAGPGWSEAPTQPQSLWHTERLSSSLQEITKKWMLSFADKHQISKKYLKRFLFFFTLLVLVF